MRECPKNRQGNGNGGNRAQSSSVAPPNRAASRGATSWQAEEQTIFMLSLVSKSMKIHQILSRSESIFCDSLCCYEFYVLPEKLLEPFSVSIPIGESILAKSLYHDCSIS
ncbi:hypothetical protein H5410_041173, partial [Solanum commersonii]